VFLTNVREDHLDTLGRDRTQIARSLTRAVPQGTSVVCAEQYKPLREYIQTELERRDAPVTFVDPPSGTESVPGSECVYGLNDVLAAVGEPPVPTQEIQDRIDTLRPSWQQLPGGRVYNAAAVNDVQSTELVRQSLVEDRETVIEPVLNLRWIAGGERCRSSAISTTSTSRGQSSRPTSSATINSRSRRPPPSRSFATTPRLNRRRQF